MIMPRNAYLAAGIGVLVFSALNTIRLHRETMFFSHFLYSGESLSAEPVYPSKSALPSPQEYEELKRKELEWEQDRKEWSKLKAELEKKLIDTVLFNRTRGTDTPRPLQQSAEAVQRENGTETQPIVDTRNKLQNDTKHHYPFSPEGLPTKEAARWKSLQQTDAANETTMMGKCWCHLNANNTVWFHHPPHAAQSMFPCWTTLSQCDSCGFMLSKDVRVTNWTHGLAEAMRCQIIHDESNIDAAIAFEFTLPDHPGYNHLWTTPEAASRLQGFLVPSISNGSLSNGSLTNGSPTLAIIDRRASRKFGNLPGIQFMVNQQFPFLQTTVAYMEDMTPLEQFRFWNSFDIILLAHGAAFANVIFARPHAVIIESKFAEQQYRQALMTCALTLWLQYFLVTTTQSSLTTLPGNSIFVTCRIETDLIVHQQRKIRICIGRLEGACGRPQ